MLVTTLFPKGACTEDTDMTVDEIASNLLTEEAKYTDLKLQYVLNVWVHMEDGSALLDIIQAEYMEKKTAGKRLRYLDRKVTQVDPNTKEEKVIVDGRVSFNGDVTRSLDRMTEDGHPMRALISAGYDTSEFSLSEIDPHTRIWYHGGKLLGDILKENAATFRIESRTEVVDGISTFKLIGTIMNGFLTMKLWVSLEKNFLPVKMQFFRTSDSKLVGEMLLSNIAELPDGRWYPKSIRSGTPGEYAHTHEISEISIEPIPEETFNFEFPSNTRVTDEVLRISYITY
jgi:hypothetical protein